MDFNAVKQALSMRSCGTKYFTRAFFADFIAAQKQRAANIENGVDDSYFIRDSSPIRLYHSYDAIYNSKFYQLNGGAYCEFLSIISGKVLKGAA